MAASTSLRLVLALLCAGRSRRGAAFSATGTDLTNPWVIPGESLHQEFELLVAAGFTPSEVLKMTGENAAKALRATDVGLIEPTRRADLVLLAQDPTENISNSRSIRWVMKAGRQVPAGLPSDN